MKIVRFRHTLLAICYFCVCSFLPACDTSNGTTLTITDVPSTETALPITKEIPLPTPTAILEELSLPDELVHALDRHKGLSESIQLEDPGQYMVTATFFSHSREPISQDVYVNPATLQQDLETRNLYGDTPTIQTEDGMKLYWIREEKAWFAVELSPDINAPVFIPFDQREVVTRVIIAGYNQPFSQEALDFWKSSPDSIGMLFVHLGVNANTGESTKFGSLVNHAATSPELTAENNPVQLIDAWFTTTLPDGTLYQFFPTKWLDPLEAGNPRADEWKIIFAASGQEIMGVEGNRAKYDELWASAAAGQNRIHVTPIFKVQDGFFNGTNNLITLFVPQPSLQALLEIPENDMANLRNPGHDMNPYKFTFDFHFQNLTSENPVIAIGIGKNDPKYIHGFLPGEIQRIIFPSMLIFR